MCCCPVYIFIFRIGESKAVVVYKAKDSIYENPYASVTTRAFNQLL